MSVLLTLISLSKVKVYFFPILNIHAEKWSLAIFGTRMDFSNPQCTPNRTFFASKLFPLIMLAEITWKNCSWVPYFLTPGVQNPWGHCFGLCWHSANLNLFQLINLVLLHILQWNWYHVCILLPPIETLPYMDIYAAILPKLVHFRKKIYKKYTFHRKYSQRKFSEKLNKYTL